MNIKNKLAPIGIVLLLIVIGTIYQNLLSLMWIGIIEVISYIWNEFWWLVIIGCIAIFFIKEMKSTKKL